MITIKQDTKYNCGSAAAAMLSGTSIEDYESKVDLDVYGRTPIRQIMKYLKKMKIFLVEEYFTNGEDLFKYLEEDECSIDRLLIIEPPLKWQFKNEGEETGLHGVVWDGKNKKVRDPCPNFKNELSLKFYKNTGYKIHYMFKLLYLND